MLTAAKDILEELGGGGGVSGLPKIKSFNL
jgi:hypothetical protein